MQELRGATKESDIALDGKVAIVTGAGQGIGREIALEYARRGAKIVVNSITESNILSTAAEARKYTDNVVAIAGDVSQSSDVKNLVGAAVRSFGGVDILVNNAGVLGPIGLLEDNNPDQWISTIKVNLFGPYICAKEVLPLMKKKKYGKLINLSGAGAPLPYPRFSAYSASKVGLLGLTQSLAAEVEDDGIDVNALAPGLTVTRLQDQIISAGPVAGAAYARAKQAVLDGGVDPGKTAALAVFLASAESNGITGRLFSARWDDWKSLKEEKLREFKASENYTIRRIDGILFGAIEGNQEK